MFLLYVEHLGHANAFAVLGENSFSLNSFEKKKENITKTSEMLLTETPGGHLTLKLTLCICFKCQAFS